CPECPNGRGELTRKKGNMDFNLYQSVIEQASPYLVSIILYFQGEPFLCPSMLRMIRLARKKNIYTITSTNGQCIDSPLARKIVESGLDRIIVSVDGTTQEVYEQYRRGGSLEKALGAISALSAWKKKLKSDRPFIVFQFLVTAQNEHQMQEAKKLAASTGADKIEFKSLQVYDLNGSGKFLLPENERYSRYRKDGQGNYEIKKKMKNRCRRVSTTAVITCEGNMVPCCFDKDGNHALGNVNENSVEAIWVGEKLNKFRQKILNDRCSIPICCNCTE
ncbi:MAG: radical SAM/SPASM domain-containing protein, partial [Bacteroidota bacterium]|nr:radical SAM/SPASM domain-containing protein [Bacteroidota bacterium]